MPNVEIRYASPTKRCPRCGDDFPRRGTDSVPRKDGLVRGACYCLKCQNGAAKRSLAKIVSEKACDNCGKAVGITRKRAVYAKAHKYRHTFCDPKCVALYYSIAGGGHSNPLGDEYCRVQGCDQKRNPRESLCLVHRYRHCYDLDMATGKKKSPAPEVSQ